MTRPSPSSARPSNSTPSTPMPTATSAAALNEQGADGRGHRLLRKAIELDPKHANAHNNLGNALNDKGQMDEAIASLPQGHRTRPEARQRPQQPRHASLNGKGQMDEAIAMLPQGHRTRPQARQCPQQPRLRAGRARDGGRGHRRSYRKAIELDPKHAKAHNNLGWALNGKGQYGRGHRHPTARPSNSTPSTPMPTTTSAWR